MIYCTIPRIYRTTLVYVDLGNALVTLFPDQQIHFNFKPSSEIDRGHIKAPQNKVGYIKHVDSKNLGNALVTLFPDQQIHFNFKPSSEIDRGHIKAPQNKVGYIKHVDSKNIYI